MAYKTVDLRDELPGDPAANQGAKEKTKGIVVHYNGAPGGNAGVAGGQLTPQQRFVNDAKDHINKNWGTEGDPASANGVQYHYGCWEDTTYILRNPDAKLWHCGDGIADGSYNYSATAVYVPISTNERATARTLQTLKEFCDEELERQGLNTREIRGHQEITPTSCPHSLMEDFVRPYRDEGEIRPHDTERSVGVATRAEIIDDFFRDLDAYPDVPYQPVGAMLIEECEEMGPEGLWISTAAALLEQESGGKNVFGCDWGNRWTTDPPYCNVEVTRERVKALIANFHQPPPGVGENGVGVTQLTTMALVEEAEGMGGAHLVRHQMRVGFRYLNNLIARFGWPEGAAAYNAGPGNLHSVMGTYGAAMARREREWAARLEGASDVPKEAEVPVEVPISLVPADFVPLDPRPGTYEDMHPTRYEWREDVAGVIRRLYKTFGSAIHVNTYVEHPGDENGRWARDTAAFDVWGEGDRNVFLDPVLGDEVWNFLFNDLNPPDIDWIIYKRSMWTRAAWAFQSWGFNPFTWHDDHIHVTYTGDFRLLD